MISHVQSSYKWIQKNYFSSSIFLFSFHAVPKSNQVTLITRTRWETITKYLQLHSNFKYSNSGATEVLLPV